MAELKDLLEERRKMVDKKATQHREIRDDWNEKTKEYTGTRNELNNEVRELIVQVREQRDLRGDRGADQRVHGRRGLQAGPALARSLRRQLHPSRRGRG